MEKGSLSTPEQPLGESLNRTQQQLVYHIGRLEGTLGLPTTRDLEPTSTAQQTLADSIALAKKLGVDTNAIEESTPEQTLADSIALGKALGLTDQELES